VDKKKKNERILEGGREEIIILCPPKIRNSPD
jgi:hypothetical protein